MTYRNYDILELKRSELGMTVLDILHEYNAAMKKAEVSTVHYAVEYLNSQTLIKLLYALEPFVECPKEKYES